MMDKSKLISSDALIAELTKDGVLDTESLWNALRAPIEGEDFDRVEIMWTKQNALEDLMMFLWGQVGQDMRRFDDELSLFHLRHLYELVRSRYAPVQAEGVVDGEVVSWEQPTLLAESEEE